ncbi:MAG: hypothetical protein COA93_09085 [Alphaproteobacteria bacterium]|nr:MAG: hypothetical protein COA93_09085 [Alphaproteobacteria bacterium]
MINIIPSRAPLGIGKKCYIEAPTRKKMAAYKDFLHRNESYHRPWVYHSFKQEYYEHYLKRIKNGMLQGCFVIDSQTDNLVGIININNILLGPMRMASLGYYGDEAYAGKGYMAEGMTLAIKYAFESLGLHRLEANIQPGNTPSIRLVQKLGFRKEGFSPKYLQIGGKWCDHERWAILDEEFGKE